MNILYCGYREWATDVLRLVGLHHRDSKIYVAYDPKSLKRVLEMEEIDIIFMAGWSWIVDNEICERYTVVGIHPSDLPDYAGGTPLQHQILDGLTKSKATLFLVPPNTPIDRGPILLKEEFSLEGGIKDVFRELTRVTCSLLKRFIEQWPNITMVEQPLDVPPARKRLKPNDSKLTSDKLESMSARQLYDFIRCREDPYPNAFIEDETGTLYIKSVGFEPKS